MSLNYSIRVKLITYYDHDYFVDGEWSEWFTFSIDSLSSPTAFSQTNASDSVTVSWESVFLADAYIYSINGGEEKETSECFVEGLKNGDKIKVRAVRSDGAISSSAYSEFIVIDSRIQLSAPVISFQAGKVNFITWELVENAEYYEIYNAESGKLYRTISYNSLRISESGTYYVRAIPSNADEYVASEFSNQLVITSSDGK